MAAPGTSALEPVRLAILTLEHFCVEPASAPRKKDLVSFRSSEELSMRAIQFAKTGGPEVLELVELEAPTVGPGQIL